MKKSLNYIESQRKNIFAIKAIKKTEEHTEEIVYLGKKQFTGKKQAETKSKDFISPEKKHFINPKR